MTKLIISPDESLQNADWTKRTDDTLATLLASDLRRSVKDVVVKGGVGSGNFNHSGQGNGKRGGSGKGSTVSSYDKAYPLAGDVVDGRTVKQGAVPNTDSISSSLTNYTVLKGIREISFATHFPGDDMPKYYSASEKKRTLDLAERIKESNEISPLIVVDEKDGMYILEGGHRFDALIEIGAKSFPALVVLNLDSPLEKHGRGLHDQGRHRPLSSIGAGGGESPLASTPHIKRDTISSHEEEYQNAKSETKTRTAFKFSYTDSKTGNSLSDKEVEALNLPVVPPNVSDVLISADRNSDLQVTWTDAKGRTAYMYSVDHQRQAAAEKFARLKEFGQAIPALRASISADLSGDDPKLREVAAVLYLIDQTGFRIGSDTDTKAEAQAYGASTLQGRHVKVDGDKVVFDYTGKKNVRIHKSITDPTLAKIISERKTSAYSEKLFDVSQSAIRDYLKRFGDFKVKDFRTYKGTKTALQELAKIKKMPKDEKSFRRIQMEIAKKVAKTLGNTPSVALSAYIDFSVWGKIRKPEWGDWIPAKLSDGD